MSIDHNLPKWVITVRWLHGVNGNILKQSQHGLDPKRMYAILGLLQAD